MSFLLFCAALIGGALNAVAGGGSFIALPALLYSGVPAVAANATNTFALWPGTASSALAYRREIFTARKWLAWLGVISVAGALAGARLLVRTSDSGFLKLLPWLMLVAAVTFTIGERLTALFRPSDGRMSFLAVLIQFAIAVYGGYFGGGQGIMTLAALSIAGMVNIHEMNGVKLVLAVLINGAALVEFVIAGAVVWKPGLIMAAGAVIGGYGAATIARRIDERSVRVLVITIAWVLTAYFFLQ